MPIYCYECKKCKATFDLLVKMSESDVAQACVECGAMETKKRKTSGNVHYKGTGFYTTDYADKFK